MTVRPPAPLPFGRQIALFCACALLGACASFHDSDKAPEQKNYTPFPFALLQAEDPAGTYWSVVTKITYDIDDRGQLTLADEGEPLLSLDDDPSHDLTCQRYGGGENQRTSWFPYTAVFVKGGKLHGIADARGAAQPLRPLSADADGRMTYTGPRARTPEYSFIPCVGDQPVTRGVRLDGYLPEAARLTLQKTGQGNSQRIELPSLDQPFLYLGYRHGRMIPLPMRPVLLGIDLDARRLVLQYQTTFSANRRLSLLQYRFVSAQGEPSEGETAARYQERTDALMKDLRQCPPPTLLPREACGDPDRRPDSRIFSSE